MKSATYLIASSLLLLCSEAVPLQKRSPTPLATTAAEWKSRTIYQLLTDRFARTDGSTDACSNLSGYCGGTYQGIINHLDYIAGMGFDAIWISPIPQNSDNGYHGYWATDFSQLNPNFGTSQDLMDLVNAAHDKNILVMLDVVANHAGIPSSSGDYTGYTFNSASQYHTRCDIDYNNQTSVEQCWISGLPDIDTEDSNVVNTLYSIVGNWTSTYGFDGLRVDTFKHVRKDFWPGYLSSANVFATAEVLSGDASYVGPYQDYTASLINYPLYYPINDAFASKKAMSELPNQITTNQNNFKDISLLTTFVDNHDNVRFLSQTSDTSLFKNALTFIMMTEGIPVYYYGSEQGFNGGSDPANREALWTSSYDTTSDLYKFTAELIKNGRQKATGTVTPNVDVQDSVYAFTRGSAFVVLNNQGSSATSSISVKVGAGISDGTTLTDIFTNTTVTVSGGSITYNLQNGLPSIFM
jgi:alpha-amylase